jgi:hypothetical protein
MLVKWKAFILMSGTYTMSKIENKDSDRDISFGIEEAWEWVEVKT